MDPLPPSTTLVLTQRLDNYQRKLAKKAYLTVILRRQKIRRQTALVRLSCAVLLLGIASASILTSNPARDALLRTQVKYTSKSVTLRWE